MQPHQLDLQPMGFPLTHAAAAEQTWAQWNAPGRPQATAWTANAWRASYTSRRWGRFPVELQPSPVEASLAATLAFTALPPRMPLPELRDQVMFEELLFFAVIRLVSIVRVPHDDGEYGEHEVVHVRPEYRALLRGLDSSVLERVLAFAERMRVVGQPSGSVPNWFTFPDTEISVPLDPRVLRVFQEELYRRDVLILAPFNYVFSSFLSQRLPAGPYSPHVNRIGSFLSARIAHGGPFRGLDSRNFPDTPLGVNPFPTIISPDTRSLAQRHAEFAAQRAAELAHEQQMAAHWEAVHAGDKRKKDDPDSDDQSKKPREV